MFTLTVEFEGLCIYELDTNRRQVAVLLPDCRKQTADPQHEDDSMGEFHTGYLRVDLANLGTAVPPADGNPADPDPKYELVHRFAFEELDFGLDFTAEPMVIGSRPDTVDLGFPDFGVFAPTLKMRPNLASATAPETTPRLLMRTVLKGGTMTSESEGKQWKFSKLFNPGAASEYGGQFAHIATWTREVNAPDLKLKLAGFDGSAPTEIVLTPVDIGDGPAISLKIANLCSTNPLEWHDFEFRTVTGDDVDFKWLYRLLEPTAGTYSDMLLGCPFPFPKLQGGAQGVQDCMGGQMQTAVGPSIQAGIYTGSQVRTDDPIAYDARSGPVFDDRALVFAIGDAGAVRPAVEAFCSGEEPRGGLEQVLYYASHQPGAELTPLYGDRSGDLLCGHGWQLAVPDLGSPHSRLGAIHHLRLASPGDGPALQKALAADWRVAYVHQPAILYPTLVASHPQCVQPPRVIRGVAAGVPDRQWSLGKCGFRKVWEVLDVGDDPGPIGIIDVGGPSGHPDLVRRIGASMSPAQGTPSSATHASQVAAVIGAIRGNGDDKGMAGCCSATLKLYNVWTQTGFDSKAYYSAFKDAADRALPVVNLSMVAGASDRTLDAVLADCVSKGVVLVAAIGDFFPDGSPFKYPAAHRLVLAVGATGRFDHRFPTSSTGSHLWICAPGDEILTVKDATNYGLQSGTSFATAHVSAAAWLARRAGARPGEVAGLLAESVEGKLVPGGGRSAEFGHGRLDMVKMARILGKLP